MYISNTQKNACLANTNIFTIVIASTIFAITIPFLLINRIPDEVFSGILIYAILFSISILILIKEPGYNLLGTLALLFFALKKIIVTVEIRPLWPIFALFLLIAIGNGVLMGIYSRNHFYELLQQKVLYKKTFRRFMGNSLKYAVYSATESTIFTAGLLLLLFSIMAVLKGKFPVSVLQSTSSSIYLTTLFVSIGIIVVGIIWIYYLRVRERRFIQELEKHAKRSKGLTRRILYSQWAYLSLEELDNRFRYQFKKLHRKSIHDPRYADEIDKLQAEYDTSKNKLEKRLIDVDGELSP